MEEKTIKKERLYDGRLIKLDLHDVELQNGQHSKREIVVHPGAVAMVPLDENNNVYLVRQFRLAANKMMLEIPAGTLNPGEAPEACAIRELQEEIGYKPNKVESLNGIYTAPGYTTEFIHLFWVTDLIQSSLDMDVDEFIEVEKMPLSEAIALIENGSIIDGKTVSGLLRVARKLGI